jgi:hypothetical protein
MGKHNHTDLIYWSFYSALRHVSAVYVSYLHLGISSQKEQKGERPLLTKTGDDGLCRQPKHVAALNKGPIYWMYIYIVVYVG